MKNISLLVWITQLGLSVALPLGGFIWLGVWLRSSLGWGSWVIFLGIGLGLYSAIQGLIHSLRIMRRLAEGYAPEDAPPVSYNDHE